MRISRPYSCSARASESSEFCRVLACNLAMSRLAVVYPNFIGADVRPEPAKVVTGEREEGDQVVVGELVRPATQPRELGIGQKPNRHEARYPRR